MAFLLAELVARMLMQSTPEAVRWYDEAAQLKVAQMDDLGDVDVVFAGTSMAWQAFVPSVVNQTTGTSSYNAGLNGGTPEVMERWLLEEVVPRTNPTTVVWGISSLDLAPNYGAQQRQVYDEALASRTGVLARVEQAIAERSELVANRSVLRSLNDTFGSGADEREASFATAREHLGSMGERLDFRPGGTDRERQIMRSRLVDYSPDPNDAGSMSRVISELRRQGITVVLAELPAPSGFVDSHPDGPTDFQATQWALAGIGLVQGVDVIQNTAVFDDDDFVDLSHLTSAGATTFSESFAT
jgi:hypothetical protein